MCDDNCDPEVYHSEKLGKLIKQFTVTLIILFILSTIKAMMGLSIFNEIMIILMGIIFKCRIMYSFSLFIFFFILFDLFEGIFLIMLMTQNKFFFNMQISIPMLIFELLLISLLVYMTYILFKIIKELGFDITNNHQNDNVYKKLEDVEIELQNKNKFPGKGVRVGGS